jgi:hypothetical protein
MIVGGYAAGILVLHRLYQVVKSKLYTMEWCATLAGRVQAQLALWRRRHVVRLSPGAEVVLPQAEALEAKLAP